MWTVKDMRTSRPATCRLLEMMDDGAIDPRTLAETCLGWMSEADVAEMARSNDLIVPSGSDEDEDS